MTPKLHEGNLWGSRNTLYFDFSRDYMGIEKSKKKTIKLYNENEYSLYVLLCVG